MNPAWSLGDKPFKGNEELLRRANRDDILLRNVIENVGQARDVMSALNRKPGMYRPPSTHSAPKQDKPRRRNYGQTHSSVQHTPVQQFSPYGQANVSQRHAQNPASHSYGSARGPTTSTPRPGNQKYKGGKKGKQRASDINHSWPPLSYGPCSHSPVSRSIEIVDVASSRDPIATQPTMAPNVTTSAVEPRGSPSIFRSRDSVIDDVASLLTHCASSFPADYIHAIFQPAMRSPGPLSLVPSSTAQLPAKLNLVDISHLPPIKSMYTGPSFFSRGDIFSYAHAWGCDQGLSRLQPDVLHVLSHKLVSSETSFLGPHNPSSIYAPISHAYSRMSDKALTEFRATQLSAFRDAHAQSLPEFREWQKAQSNNPVKARINLPLLSHFLKKFDYHDRDVIQPLADGFPVIGGMPVCGLGDVIESPSVGRGALMPAEKARPVAMTIFASRCLSILMSTKSFLS